MLHSFPQYIGIAPSMTNIIGTYAFCNLHDVCEGDPICILAHLTFLLTSVCLTQHGERKVSESRGKELTALLTETLDV